MEILAIAGFVLLAAGIAVPSLPMIIIGALVLIGTVSKNAI